MTENWVSKKQKCAICGNDQKHVLFQQQFSKLSIGSLMNGYDVVICQSCGFAFADNIPDQTDFDLYYREMSKYEHQDYAGEPSEFETRQFPALAHFIKKYIPTSQARILEIGCANGGLLNALKQLGYLNILGIDPSPVCAQNAEQLYQIQVLTTALSDINVEIGQFDFIILVAVLEHIQDLNGSLQKLHHLLTPAGKLYIEVPDATKFTSSPDAPFQEFSIEHISFFSPISLANLLRAHFFLEVSSTQTSYNQTDTHTGHAIRMVFQKSNINKKFDPVKDFETEVELKKYIEASQKVEDRIHKTVNELVDGQQPLFVWGVGTHTQRLLATSRLANAKIIAFVDSNPNYQDKQLNNIPIIHPKKLVGTSEPILVSSRIFQSEIVYQIRFELKLQSNIFTLYEDKIK
ncbi:MAG: class I SAM-dependent methyltransferase [Chloroflexi bacterium]|nr:class I SAM-dependent methyltransferase [Chloroflexota bacterium]